MYLCYDEAVEIALNAYDTLNYTSSCRYAFRIVVREFKKYKEDIGLPYSPELFQQWINSNRELWNIRKLKDSKRAMSILGDIMKHGCVTTSLKAKIERTPAYKQLSSWSRTLVDNYLTTLNNTYGNSYQTRIKNSCSHFFLFLESTGITSSSQITHNIVKTFYTKDTPTASNAKTQRNNDIRHCLMYMADLGLIAKTISLVLNKFIIHELIIVTELPESERNRFLRFFNSAEANISQSKADYDEAAMKLADLHKIQRYSVTIRKSNFQATRIFRIFMDANLFAYSNDLALEWLEFYRKKWSQVKYLSFRRALLSINEILCTGTLSTNRFSIHKPKYSLSEWGRELLSQYYWERKREGCADSTLDMINSSCSRFITFLDNHDITSEKEITYQVIKDFQTQDNHSTVEGKNAYAIKIRGFIRFLARKKLVPETLELAISTEMAPHNSIVTTLSDNQIDAIYTFRQNVERKIELRNAAIIMLGLRMGLRGSDIANLKLSDISWKESSISFIQKKTGVYLKLPLPIDVGNSLYRYICEGRPQSDSHYVFVHHRSPYCKIGRSTFGKLLKTAVAAYCESEEMHGFHLTRKTFASKLLATGTPVTIIAAALGHVGVDTVDEYLATNGEKMRLCAIDLKNIEYCGGFSL